MLVHHVCIRVEICRTKYKHTKKNTKLSRLIHPPSAPNDGGGPPPASACRAAAWPGGDSSERALNFQRLRPLMWTVFALSGRMVFFQGPHALPFFVGIGFVKTDISPKGVCARGMLGAIFALSGLFLVVRNCFE